MTKITKRTVDALLPEGPKPCFLWDETLAGFGVKALPTGTKRYVVKYRAEGGGRSAAQRWLTLGTHGQLTPDQARSLAQQVLAAVARGEDPQLQKQEQRAAAAVNELWQRFSTEQLPLKKTQTQYDYRNLWAGALGPQFGKTKVKSVSRNEVDRFHKSMRDTPYKANRALALFARLMSLAETWQVREQGTNPCTGVERFQEQARNRYLSKAELERLSEAMDQLLDEKAVTANAVNAIELLLLTGARLNEILKAEWSWVDFDRQVLNLPDSKTGAKPVYLSSAALDVLRRQAKFSEGRKHIFPSQTEGKNFTELRKPWRRICERAEIEGVRLHDLRHTAASIAVGQGASLAIVGKLLGHTQAQTTQRYAHVDIDPALKAANELGAAVSDALKRRPKTP